MVTPAARREAVAHLCGGHGVSERRACRVIGSDRTSNRYRSRRPDDASTRARLRELAAVRRRFGWQRLKVLLSREGAHLNHKKLRRLYTEERLQVRRRIGRKRAAVTRMPLLPAERPNERWSMDFVRDALSDGRRFRILAAVDDYTRENLCLVADTSLPGSWVIRELEAVIARRGLPRQMHLGQWPRVQRPRDARLVARPGARLALHRARSLRQAQGEGRSRMPSSKASMVACATSS